MKKRVVITGLGIVAPNGIGKSNYWEAITSGISGVNKISSFDVSSYPTKIAAQVNDFKPTDFMDKKDSRWSSRFAQISLAATRMAVEDAELCIEREDSYRVGIAVGTAIGSMEIIEGEVKKYHEAGTNSFHPFSAISINPNAAVGMIALQLKTRGANFTINTGCSAGLSAVAHAYDSIVNERAEVMITGGAEAPVFPCTFDSFCAAHVMTKRNNNPGEASRPFEKSRDGYVIGEGSGFMIIEEREHALSRGAYIYAEIAGYGVTNDCYSMIKIEPTGEGVAEAMKLALKHSGLSTVDIDYLNAHGSSSITGDRRETKAIKDVFGEHAYNMPISSIKSMVGQSLAGASGMQVVTGALVVKNSYLPPTINYEEEDPVCDLDYVPNKARRHNVDTIMINSFGMGGNNISMILKKHEDDEVEDTYNYTGNYERDSYQIPAYMMKNE